MFRRTAEQLNRKQIKAQLKSAVMDLTPNVLDRIDLSVPQTEEAVLQEGEGRKPSAVIVMSRRLRVMGTLAAACIAMVVIAGGTYTYQNGKVDSVIGIDVNPSVELSVNRKNRVLEAEPLNEDAKVIMEEMDLKGVDLNVAVNAVIGSMVTHGFLDDLDNAILVTVSNDSVSKASALRSSVVNDIQETLEENQVRAVVYDQQVIEEDDVKALADEYHISYGKAYFLKELIDQNPDLTMEDMEALAPLTMEEIAREITERSYAVGGHAGVSEETTTVAQASSKSAETTPKATEETTTTAESETETESEPETTTAAATTAPPMTAPATQPELPEMTTEEQTTEAQEPVSNSKIVVDNADYENGVVYISFKTKVKWKNPTVAVTDDAGNTYSAMVGDTDSSSCEIYVSGLEGGMQYTFVLGGISPKNGKQTTVKSTFDTPVIGNGAADEDPTEPTEETKETETQPQTTEPNPSEASSASPDETETSQEPESTQPTEPPTEVQTEPQTPAESDPPADAVPAA